MESEKTIVKRKATTAKWQKEHPERVKEIQARYLAAHPEAGAKASAKYRAAHLEERREADREAGAQRRAQDPEKERERWAADRIKHREHRKEYSAKYNAAHREEQRLAAVRYRTEHPGFKRQYLYGLTPEEFAARVALQDGRCAVCQEPMTKMCVDHDHDTGLVRGILCSPCNSGLGMFRDDPERLVAALIYLDPEPNKEA